MLDSVKTYLIQTQQQLTQALLDEDNQVELIKDNWARDAGGGGTTHAFANGDVFEKAAINFSHVTGKQLPATASAQRPELAGRSFHATGVSLIIHPLNPYCPTTHMNVRFFMAEKPGHDTIWWFGGGFDLTPYYGFVEDCQHWHQTAKQACEPFGREIYPHYKQWADEYFYLKHRQEPRGIGGIFFDDLNELGFEQSFALTQSIAEHFLPAYLPILQRRKKIPYGERERSFQNYRRGRYVEFNLLYDRGTLFGLQSGGRTESILCSLPPVVNWHYNWQAEKNSPEEKLLTDFLKATT